MGRFSSIWRSSALLALAASLSAAGIQVPNGAEIQVRLKSKVSSQTSKPKDPVEVVVIAPVPPETSDPNWFIIRTRTATHCSRPHHHRL